MTTGAARILDAAYACFARNGLRRTTIDDIAREAGVSRPTVYRYVANKDEALQLLVDRALRGAMAEARAVAESDAPARARVLGILRTKLDLSLAVWRDSPAHAAELLRFDVHAPSGPGDAYATAYADLLTGVLAPPLAADDARDVADVLLALTLGLEADVADPQRPYRRLRQGVDLITAALPIPPEEHP
jgi:AcrR family transcriptional regulator